jgi:hypothetical protein
MQRSVHEMMEYTHDGDYDMPLTLCTRNYVALVYGYVRHVIGR